MFKFIRSLVFPSPKEKIKKLKDAKYKEAVLLQRNGKLREYAKLIKEIQDLEEQYVQLSVAEKDE